MVVGSDSANLLDDFLNNFDWRLQVLVQLEFGVLDVGTIGVLGDDATDSGPEYSFEYFIRQEVRGTPVVTNAVDERVELNVDFDYSMVGAFLEGRVRDPSMIDEVDKRFRN